MANITDPEVDEDQYEDAYENIPVASQMDLKSALDECNIALNLFLNNKFSEALDLLRPWSKDSMYHALGYSTMHAMQAAMTFEQNDILAAIGTMKEALQTCQKFRKKNSVVESLSHLISKQGADQLTEEEMHAEMCYAECLLQKAALTLVQDENMINFIKGGIKIRTSYNIYRECQQIVQMTQDRVKTDVYCQFEGGVKLGIGAFNLMLSLLPLRILRLLEFIGFSGNRDLGLAMLREGAATHSLRAILCALTLLMYQTYITVVLGGGEGNLQEAEALLEPYLKKYPNGSIIIFYAARICILKGSFEMAQVKFEECIAAQEEWRQIHHLCYWELMWSNSFQQQWLEAYRYADLLCKESRWSQAIYTFQKAAILSMLPEQEVKKLNENVEALFRRVESLKQRFAGKSIPTEKFAVRKARRYLSPTPVKLVLPPLEMMYIWNGFSILGKRADLTENMLVTIEKAEIELQKHPKPAEYQVDDESLVQLLKGLCLKHLGRSLQAELCFNQVIQNEKRIRYDHYLVPYAHYEMGMLYKGQGQWEKAKNSIETAKNNYKDYSMESRLHFRIHAAMNSLNTSFLDHP
ncbi:tetratricopeptide repeat protein 39B isoform X1 [Pristis pectinata]|uniref:tetratricopeptide repeat protein 39B isoform X1 n=1 Tax=Pristis pectinata TaxID=685728 RepID=UPI00223D8302|nr:tetratricopeptide repeat protein 39B isoform X1 [Pristis pectinata]XP_051875194.1 tetratricopeptide repeat protein 39B isoform X1 [Pristis pectinata]